MAIALSVVGLALSLQGCMTSTTRTADRINAAPTQPLLLMGVLPAVPQQGKDAAPGEDAGDDATPSSGEQESNPSATESQSVDDSEAERQKRQYELIAPILLDDSTDGDNSRRVAAAEELMAIGTPEAYGVLEQALRSGQPAMMLSVIRALDASVEEVPQLLNAAVEVMPTAPEPVQEPLWRMLAHHEQRVLEDVMSIALDSERAADHRVPAIGALGAFRTRTAAERLIDLLDPKRQEPQAITSAACAALSRLTGMPYGDEPESWRQWWAKARKQTREQWLFDQVQRLVRERGTLERELNQQRRRTSSIEQRVVDTLKDLFRALPNDIDQQLAPLPDLLTDELAVVRRFALERIRFISRDLEIPRAMKDRVAARLDDADPTIRQNAARLLHDLNYPGLNARLADRLAQESSTEVAAAYIEILQSRPTRQAIEPLLSKLDQPELTASVCQALWSAVERTELSDLDAAVREKMRARLQALENTTSPAVVRLIALLCEPEALTRYEAMLSDAGPELRAAVAQAFQFRGHHEPLLAHAGDEAVYPSAMHVMAEAEATPETLKTLLEMRPPNDSLRSNWTSAITNLCRRIEPAGLSKADDLLAGAAGNASVNNGAVNTNGVSSNLTEVRLELLSNAAGLPAERMTIDVRRDLLLRLAILRMELGRYEQAHEVLDTLGGADPTPELVQLRFRAAIQSGRFDRAAEILSDAAAWVSILEEIMDSRPEHARRLHDEIEQRFANTLDDTTRTAWEAIQQRLNSEDEVNAQEPSAAEVSASADDAGG